MIYTLQINILSDIKAWSNQLFIEIAIITWLYIEYLCLVSFFYQLYLNYVMQSRDSGSSLFQYLYNAMLRCTRRSFSKIMRKRNMEMRQLCHQFEIIMYSLCINKAPSTVDKLLLKHLQLDTALPVKKGYLWLYEIRIIYDARCQYWIL